MEHSIKIAFWIVTLSGCLQAKSIPMEDLNIASLRTNVTCPPDSTFYTPTNVKVHCITKALDCVMAELDGTVREECDDPKGYINQTLDFFDAKINERMEKGHALLDSTECACEIWSQAPFSQFLTKLVFLLESGNSVL